MNEISYTEEIRLSRELAKAIEQEIASYGQTVPYSVYRAYLRLVEHYHKQQEEGVM